MGEVWRARHVALKAPVAIKFLHGSLASSESKRKRFLTEAQVTASLKTRHAVQVFDFGVTDEGIPFLVMELLEGETLDKRIVREGRLSVADTAPIMRKAARALDRAHALGIVHRDFKPENIILLTDEEGEELVKVVDFGIAKLFGQLESSRQASKTEEAIKNALTSFSATNHAVGSPYYMAPEQVLEPAEVGPAADIWVFGVVAYECLTGRRPFDDESVPQLLRRILKGEPPIPASACVPVPKMFDDWFKVACAREPKDRFPDALTAATALAIALERPDDARLTVTTLQERPAPRRMVNPLAATLDARKASVRPGRGSMMPAASGASTAANKLATIPKPPKVPELVGPTRRPADAREDQGADELAASAEQKLEQKSLEKGSSSAPVERDRAPRTRRAPVSKLRVVAAILGVVTTFSIVVFMRMRGGEVNEAPEAASPQVAELPPPIEPASAASSAIVSAAVTASAAVADAPSASEPAASVRPSSPRPRRERPMPTASSAPRAFQLPPLGI